MGDNLLVILLKLILLSFGLLLVGEPLRLALLRYFSPFRNLVPLQAAILDVYLGGFILYAIAIVPLQIFSWSVAWFLLLASAGFLIVLNRKRIWKLREPEQIRQYWKLLLNNKSIVWESVIVISMFLVNLGIQVFSVRQYIFGSIHDTSLHALFVQVILENKQVPSTLQPYMPEGIIYPQAPHVIFAFASYIVGWEAARSVLYVSTLFNAMSVLGAYYLGKKLWPKGCFSVSFAFLFAFVSNWPLYVTWGSNALIVGFPFFFISLSFLPFLSKSGDKSMVKEFVIAGVLFGYLAVLYLLLYEVVILSAILTLLFLTFRYRSYVKRRLSSSLILIGGSVFPMSVFLLRYVEFYIYPGYNPGAVSDLPKYEPARVVRILDVLNYPFESQNRLLQFELWFLFIMGVAVTTLVFLTKRKDESVRNIIKVALPTFCAVLIMTFSTYLPISSIIPLELGTIIALVVPICLFISVFNVKLYSASMKKNGEFITREFKGVSARIKSLTVIGILIFLVAYTPFVYYRVLQDPDGLTSSYGAFAVTTQDDYDLMVWMRDKLPRDVIILVNPNEPGSFIPSVSHLKVILPFTGNRRSPSYQKLTELIQQKVLDATTFDLMKHFNITYVYVGAKSTYWWDRDTKWNPQIFLSNPEKFTLVHNIGDAYLFKVCY